MSTTNELIAEKCSKIVQNRQKHYDSGKVAGTNNCISKVCKRSFTTFDIPEGVAYINAYAFYNCSYLESVSIPTGVTKISTSAFELCESLKNVIIPNTVTTIGAKAFQGCTSLTTITIPENVTSFGNSAFNECTQLEKIYFNAINVGSVSENYKRFSNAGASGTGITVVIGKGVTHIPKYFFGTAKSSSSAANIVKVVFEEGSACQDGIYMYSFAYLDKLVELVLVEGITTIGADAFYGCTSLKSITIPKSLTKINVLAFGDCPNIKDVYYAGSASDWDKIQISDTTLQKATIHYNS